MYIDETHGEHNQDHRVVDEAHVRIGLRVKMSPLAFVERVVSESTRLVHAYAGHDLHAVHVHGYGYARRHVGERVCEEFLKIARKQGKVTQLKSKVVFYEHLCGAYKQHNRVCY